MARRVRDCGAANTMSCRAMCWAPPPEESSAMNVRARIGPVSARVEGLEAHLDGFGTQVPKNRDTALGASYLPSGTININLPGSTWRADGQRTTGCYRAEALVEPPIVVDYESRQRGSPICDLARKLVKAGYDPDTEIQIWRDDTLCFKPAPLRIWAKLRAVERDGRSVRFETWEAMPKGKAAALRAA